jgi:integrase
MLPVLFMRVIRGQRRAGYTTGLLRPRVPGDIGRHTGRSLGGDAGVEDDKMQEQLGHATKKMSANYNHPEAAAMRAAANDVATYVREAGS